MISIVRFLRGPVLLCGLAAVSMGSTAQTLRSSSQLESSAASAVNGQVDGRTVDYIVALINSEPLTNNEVRQRLLRVEQQYAQRGLAMPPRDDLAREVMEQLVGERAQIQDATELGLRIDEATLEQAEQGIAAQNQLSLEEFRRRVAAEGLDLNRYRNELRNQLLLRKVREREAERVHVSNSEIEAHILELNAKHPDQAEILLNHILIKVPDSVDAQMASELQAKAEKSGERARSGEAFAALARELSDAPEGPSGGSFGWRSHKQLPALFVQSTRDLAVGQVAGPVRSPAGWHLLKVVDRRQGVAPELMLSQTHASHILLRLDTRMTQAQALRRLAEMRAAVSSGQASFEALAREFSQDGSASQGGDLGWAVPGQFVPEFDAVMDALRPGEMSEPMVSRFGVHLIRVNERREVPMTPEQQREAVRNVLREDRVAEALQTWAQDVRARAYVEFRDPPRP